jgi:hypothetical protein
VASRASAENAVLMLQRYEFDVVDVQKVGGAAVGINVLLREFKPDAARIGVTGLGIVDRQGDAGGLRILGGDGFAQIGCKRGDAALTRQIVADEGDAVER